MPTLCTISSEVACSDSGQACGLGRRMASDAARVSMVLGGAAFVVLLAVVGVVLVVVGKRCGGRSFGGRADGCHSAVSDASGNAGPRPEPLDTGGAARALAEPLDPVPDAADDAIPPAEPEVGAPGRRDGTTGAVSVAETAAVAGAGKTAADAPRASKKKRSCKTSGVVKKSGVYHVPRRVLDGYASSPAKADDLGSFWWAKNKKGEKTESGWASACPKVACCRLRLGDLGCRSTDRSTSIARAVAIYGSACEGTAVVVRRKEGREEERPAPASVHRLNRLRARPRWRYPHGAGPGFVRHAAITRFIGVIPDGSSTSVW